MTGDQHLLDDGVLDYEWQTSNEVVVRATDAGDLFFDETFVIGINESRPDRGGPELCRRGARRQQRAGGHGRDLGERGREHSIVGADALGDADVGATVRVDVNAYVDGQGTRRKRNQFFCWSGHQCQRRPHHRGLADVAVLEDSEADSVIDLFVAFADAGRGPAG